jgi:SAM-dependent methyltransferase
MESMNLTQQLDFLKDNGIYMPMINDTARNVFYKSIIDQYAKDKIVVDIGSGSGLLSVLAADAGAKKIYAVEIDPGRTSFINNMAQVLGLQDKIQAINGNFLDLSVAGDLYISETLGRHIFNENIIDIADHARKLGGVFAPGIITVWAEAYSYHPIFTVCQTESEADDFSPDIEVNQNFQNLVSSAYQKSNPNIKSKSNILPNFFKMYDNEPDMKQLKINKIYNSDSVTIDLTQPKIDLTQLELSIPPEVTENKKLLIAIFWSAAFNDLQMQVRDTWWSTPVKIIENAKNGVSVKYQTPDQFIFGQTEHQASWYFYT